MRLLIQLMQRSAQATQTALPFLRLSNTRIALAARSRPQYGSQTMRLLSRQSRAARVPRRPYSTNSKPSSPVTDAATNTHGPVTTATKSDASLSLSARLRKLSREYGWSAFGVYMALSALDFPFCFLAVRWLGTEKIGRWEHNIVQWVKRAIPFQWPASWGGPAAEPKPAEQVQGDVALIAPLYDHGVRQAEEANKGDSASIWTQLALAYAIHKSFIFLRVPLTAAITPNVVRTLRGWGWNIGKIKPKAERVAAKAERQAAKAQKGA